MHKKLHQGEFIKAVLDDHDKVLARIAEKAAMSPQNLQNVFKRMRIDEELIDRLSVAAKLDLRAMMRAEEERMNISKTKPLVAVSEPAPHYGPAPAGNQPIVIVLSPGDPAYAEVLRKLIEKNG